MTNVNCFERKSYLFTEFGFENCLEIFMSKTRRIISKHLKNENSTILLNMNLEQLYTKYKILRLDEIYPVLGYVLRKLLDSTISDERKVSLMSVCYTASFTPNNI